jgi:hypothetical protein
VAYFLKRQTARGKRPVFLRRAYGNKGAIVGTATYSGTNTAIAAGSHGVLLIPADIKIAASPSNDTTYETDGNGYIPIDGENVNGSAFIMVGGQATPFPTTPDCNATNLPANDNQMVHLHTDLPAGMGTGGQAQLLVQNNGRARVTFWKDRQKQQQFMPNTAVAFSSFPADLYVDGTVPGAAPNEIVLTLQVTVGSQTVNANSINLTVTPVLTSYQSTILNTAAPFLYKAGVVWALASGTGNQNISIDSEMTTNNLTGQPQQIQTLAMTNPGGVAATIYAGDPATTAVVSTKKYDFASPNGGATLADFRPGEFPYYKYQTTSSQNGNTYDMGIQDLPGFSIAPIYPTGAQTTVINMTENFTDYVVWVYPDGTAYPLGQTSWNIVWAGKIAVGPPTSYLWAPSPSNANNVGQPFQLNNSPPTLNSATSAAQGLGSPGGFQ